MFLRGSAWLLTATMLIGLLEMAVQIGSAVFIGRLIRFFSDIKTAAVSNTPAPSPNGAFLFALGLSLTSLATVFTHHLLFYWPVRASMNMRAAAIGLVFKKALRLSSGALQHTTPGQVANLVSNDINRFERACIYCGFLVLGPAQAVVSIYLIYQLIGPAVFAGDADAAIVHVHR